MRSKHNRKTFGLDELKHRLRHHASDAGSQPAQQPAQPKSAPPPRPPAKKRPIQRKKTASQALSSAERSLFRQAMSNVEPIKSTGRRALTAAWSPTQRTNQQQILQRRAHAQNHSTMDLEAQLSDDYFVGSDTEYLEHYLNPMCGTDVLRDLKRGRWPLEASIDLHGATLDHARLRLERFLQHSLAEEFRCIRIVHGKGYGSVEQRPVLLHQIRRWLTQLETVLAFCDCPPNEGGSGAVKVLLRKPRIRR